MVGAGQAGRVGAGEGFRMRGDSSLRCDVGASRRGLVSEERGVSGRA